MKGLFKVLKRERQLGVLEKVILETPIDRNPALYRFSPQANSRVVYISGPHGSGKSTLQEDLQKATIGTVQEQIAHMEGLDENISRQIWRIALHCIEHRENLVKAGDDGNLVIGDRCYIDDTAYMAAFYQLGWITKKQLSDLLDLTDKTYQVTGTPKPQRFIIVTPPLGWNISRIEERWKDGDRTKWRERDFNYLAVVMSQYVLLAQQLVKERKALRVVETDRRERVDAVRLFLNSQTAPQPLTAGRTFTEGRGNRCISD